VISPSFPVEDAAMSFLAVSWGEAAGVLLRERIFGIKDRKSVLNSTTK
jgi:hypothetical protein